MVKRAWCSGIQDIEALAGLFRVSCAAMQVRLDYLGLTDGERPVETYFRRQAPSIGGAWLIGGLEIETFPLTV